MGSPVICLLTVYGGVWYGFGMNEESSKPTQWFRQIVKGLTLVAKKNIWSILVVALLMVGAFFIGVLVGRAGDIAVVLGSLVTFAVALIGWLIAMMKIDQDAKETAQRQVQEQHRWETEFYGREKLAQLRDLYAKLVKAKRQIGKLQNVMMMLIVSRAFADISENLTLALDSYEEFSEQAMLAGAYLNSDNQLALTNASDALLLELYRS